MYFPHQWEVAQAKAKKEAAKQTVAKACLSAGLYEAAWHVIAGYRIDALPLSPRVTLYPHPREIPAWREREIRGETDADA
jgi:hypothetical protein